MGLFSKKSEEKKPPTFPYWIFLIFITGVFIFGVVSLLYFFFPKISSRIRNKEKTISIETLTKITESIENKIETKIEEKIPKKNTSEEEKEQPATAENKAETAVSGANIKQNIITWGFEVPASKRTIDTVIVHSSYCATGKDVYSLACILKEYKDYTVSAHYIIDRDGTVYQLVQEKNIAYHAGLGQTPDKRNHINNFSIGIELMNTKIDKYTAEQYDSLNKLLKEIKIRYTIKYVLGHDQIAPDRKTDPWNFDWTKITK
jgi:N-acetyl-anhydromuramyl-L-alanine amidase AmpD